MKPVVAGTRLGTGLSIYPFVVDLVEEPVNGLAQSEPPIKMQISRPNCCRTSRGIPHTFTTEAQKEKLLRYQPYVTCTVFFYANVYFHDCICTSFQYRLGGEEIKVVEVENFELFVRDTDRVAKEKSVTQRSFNGETMRKNGRKTV